MESVRSVARHALLPLLAVALGCATGPVEPPPDAPLVLSLPVNFDHTTPDLLQAGFEPLSLAVVDYVRQQGLRCETVALASVLEVWPSAIEAVGGLAGADGLFDPSRLDAARGVLAERLSHDRDVAAVVVPTVLVDRAVFGSQGKQLRWDSVRRTVPLRREDSFRRDLMIFRGDVPVTSLWASLYAADGTLLGSGRGGLEVVQRPDIVGQTRTTRRTVYHYEWTDREDLFQDPDILAGAAELALEDLVEQVPR
jgi:hypothetical protein